MLTHTAGLEDDRLGEAVNAGRLMRSWAALRTVVKEMGAGDNGAACLPTLRARMPFSGLRCNPGLSVHHNHDGLGLSVDPTFYRGAVLLLFGRVSSSARRV